MRILQLGKYYPPVRGGMETVLQHLCEGLLDRGHQVTALVAGDQYRDRIEILPTTTTEQQGRLIRAGSWVVLNSQPITPSLPSLLRREIKEFQPDIVHLHLPNPAACATTLTVLPKGSAARKPRLAVWYHADITRQRLGRLLVNPLVKASLDRADGICVSSEALRVHSQTLKSWTDKVEVIPFGIDMQPWSSVNSHGHGPFLFIGRLVYYKGLSLLLSALGRVPEASLIIVGSGPLRRQLLAQVARDGLQKRVQFVGELSVSELQDTMSKVRALVLPSSRQSETFGLVQLEAMAAGLPVISTGLPTGVAEVNVDGVTGRVVPPADIASLAAALAEIQADPAQARRWGEAGRQRVQQYFTRSIMVDRLEAWYDRMLSVSR